MTAESDPKAQGRGVFYLAAEHIGRSLHNPELEVRAIETKGPLDNLKRMARSDCDAAIVQRDALMIQTTQDLSNRLKIGAPVGLYDELLHLICRRTSGIGEISDLLRGPHLQGLLIGEPGSGSETTWRALTGLDDNYKAGNRNVRFGIGKQRLRATMPNDCL